MVVACHILTERDQPANGCQLLVLACLLAWACRYPPPAGLKGQNAAILDVVRVPLNIAPGSYVLGFRCVRASLVVGCWLVGWLVGLLVGWLVGWSRSSHGRPGIRACTHHEFVEWRGRLHLSCRALCDSYDMNERTGTWYPQHPKGTTAKPRVRFGPPAQTSKSPEI